MAAMLFKRRRERVHVRGTLGEDKRRPALAERFGNVETDPAVAPGVLSMSLDCSACGSQ
jgi:hypothetical protein